MGTHIFLASKENFKRCLEYGLYGGIAHSFERTNSEIIAGFETIRPSDFIFFYVKNIGIYGLWKAKSRPFFDERPVWESKDQIYPYRVIFEPSIREFRKPIALSDILDLRDKGKIWTFDLGTFTKKSHQPVTTEEGKELIRLLLRNNPVFYPLTNIQKPYSTGDVPLPLKLETDSKGQIKIEGYLNAWFMRSFAEIKLKNLIGEYYDFLNYVPTSFNTVMDIFLTHVTLVDGVEILHKFTCIELKTGTCTEE